MITREPQSEIYREFLRRTDAFVANYMDGYEPSVSGGKVIHDCVWGTVSFYPWEIAVIDSPLFQRLRSVNQLGLAALTYPSAHHTRFEHTLGVVAVVSKMVSSINGGGGDLCCISGGNAPIPPQHVRLLRMAALLHDIGHCFFSHLSESIYGAMPEMQELKAAEPVFSGAQPHEIFAYVIINTPTFRRFFAEKSAYPFEDGEGEELLADIGRMIVGCETEPKDGVKYCYLTEMINGQFDADAIDYLRRDSYATGLALSYHIDRFLYKLRIVDRKNSDGTSDRHLTVSSSGIGTIEEMVFSKQMLTRYIYQHQKVVAVESLMWDLVCGMQRGGRLTHPCDFLYFSDNDIYSLGSRHGDGAMRPAAADWRLDERTERTVGDIAEQVLTRRLPKKAMVLNVGNVISVDGWKSENVKVNDLVYALRSAGDLRAEIAAEAARTARVLGLPLPEVYDVHVSVPKVSTAKNFSRTSVLTYDGDFVPMSDLVDLNEWSESFSGHSYNAYVFSTPDMLPAVSIAALRVLHRHGIECHRGKIFSSLKESEEIESAFRKVSGATSV